MADPQSDDSSAASSGDEMLNLVPFSQECSSTSPEKGGGMDSEDEIGSEGMHLSQDSSGEPGKKRKHDEASEVAEMEEKARVNANKAFNISFHGRKIGELFWRAETVKGAKMIFPVRAATREDIVGLGLRDYNSETERPVEYVQYPHLQRKGFGQFTIASIKSLTPYYGGEEDRNRWCPIKFEQYSKQLRRAHKGFRAVDLKTEESFLQIVLEKSIAEVKKEMLLRAEVDEVVPEETPTTDAEIECKKSDEDEDDDEENTMGSWNRTRGNRSGLQEKTEPLRVRDRIAFYKQQGTAGDPDALCENTILYIDPKDKHPLTIDDPFTHLQSDHLVKRIQRYHRGKLLHNDGQWRSINKFILKKEGDPNAFSKVLSRDKDHTNEIFQRTKEKAIAEMEKDGFCPRDMLR